MKKSKNIFLGISLLYLTLYLPVILMTYFPQWYIFNCKFHQRCNFIGYSNALKYIDELTDFFLHKNSLQRGWTEKEKSHLEEVRAILDVLAIVAGLCTALFIFTFNRSKMAILAIINLLIILCLLLLIPFFKTFWINVFHPLLFYFFLWRNNYLDRSFYIMPRIFFKHSIIFLIFVSSLLNGVVWFAFRKERKKGRGDPIS